MSTRHNGEKSNEGRARNAVEPKVINSSDVKRAWGAIVREVRDSGVSMIVESYGRPAVAVVPAAHVAELELLREQKHRKEAWALLESAVRTTHVRHHTTDYMEVESKPNAPGKQISRNTTRNTNVGQESQNE